MLDLLLTIDLYNITVYKGVYIKYFIEGCDKIEFKY